MSIHIIGASLSEPHTSVGVLAEFVCPYTVNFKWAYLNISWRPGICPARCRIGEGLLPESSVGMKEARGTKTT